MEIIIRLEYSVAEAEHWICCEFKFALVEQNRRLFDCIIFVLY